MTGRIVYLPPLPQACTSYAGCADRPDASAFQPGTIWQCDLCDKQWVVVSGSQYNEYYNAWRDAAAKTLPGESRG